MASNEKRHWCITVGYAALLVASALTSPHWSIGDLLRNGLLQILAPTVGTLVLSAGTLVLMLRRRISIAHGVASIVLLVAVSLVCLCITIPPMMHI